MKLIKLELENFRNHTRTTLSLSPMTAISGANNAGKSSIQQAIEMALLGYCSATDRAGRGMADLIQVGEKEAKVRLEVHLGDKRLLIARTIQPGKQALTVEDAGNGREVRGSQKELQRFILDSIGARPELVSALLNVSSFISLPPAEQKAMIAELCSTSIKAADLEKEMAAAARKAGVAVKDMDFGKELLYLEDLEGIYKDLYEERRAAKSRLSDLEARAAGAHAEDKPDYFDRLDEMRSLMDTLESERAAKRAEHQELVKHRVAYSTIKNELDDVNRRIEKIRIPEMDRDPQEYVEGLQAVRDQMAAARTNLAGVQSKIEVAEKELEDLAQLGTTCPLSPDVKCSFDEKAGKKLLQEKRAALKSLRRSAANYEAHLEKLSAEEKRLAGLASEAEKALYQLKQLEELRESAEKLRRRLPEKPDMKREVDLEASIASLEERIQKGYSMIAQAEAWKRNAELRDEEARLLELTRERLAELEFLCHFYGPKGILSSMIGTDLTALEASVNRSLEELTRGNYTVSIRQKPDFHIVVSTAGRTVELRHLSTSERMRVGLAFSTALAEISGLKLLVLDDAEILDDSNRAAMITYLGRLLPRFDTILVFATSHRSRVRSPGIAGLDVYWIEDGTLEKIGARPEVSS